MRRSRPLALPAGLAASLAASLALFATSCEGRASVSIATHQDGTRLAEIGEDFARLLREERGCSADARSEWGPRMCPTPG